MKRNILAFVALFFVTLGVQAGNSDSYTYILDLTKVEDDRIKIVLNTPKLKVDEILFSLPKMIPGTYSVQDYGRFVDTFKAFDKKGNELTVNKEGTNGWKISNAKKLSKITYWVSDTFDDGFEEGGYIFEPAGTNIEEGLNFVINSGGFFGYFDGMTRKDFTFHVVRASSFYGATGLIATQTGQKVADVKALKNWEGNADQVLVDTYDTPNYDLLIDSPLMYCEPDTSVFEVGGAEIVISVFSPEQKVKAEEIKSNLISLLSAQKDYLGGKLPVNKYAFILYFTERQVRAIGALEHSYSSFYSLKNGGIESMQSMLNNVTAHEFFHIVTPLNIHAEQIHEFDFDAPTMSEHLWLYEGITEFFAGNVQVKYGIMTPDQYLKDLQKKIGRSKSSFNDTLAFTVMSKNALDKHADQYGNVYQKGALIGMALDLKLRSLSDGVYGVQNLMADLSMKYGKDQAFKDEDLFDVITAMTYPEIGVFLNTYVAGSTALPFDELFALAGVEYIAAFSKQEMSIGITQKSIGYNPELGKLYVANDKALDEIGREMGLTKGDVLMKVNGKEIPLAGMLAFFNGIREEIKVGEQYTITVSRTDEEGVATDQQLSIEMREVEVVEEHKLNLKEELTESQQKIRNGWLTSEG